MIRHTYFTYRWSCVLYVFIFLPFMLSFAQIDEGVRWHQWTEGVIATQASGKYMLVDVYTDWCGWCKKMDREVYIHPQVQQLLATNFVTIKLNAESTNLITNGTNQYTEQECAKLLNVNSYPTILVFNSNFQLVAKLNGYRDANTFIRFLHYVSGKRYKRYTFDQYLTQVPPEY